MSATSSLAQSSASAYVERVLGLVGAHAHALNAMLTVSRIEWSDEISTACVECVDRPRLLLNPSFVERWCFTPERLTALILHELQHIALGHTRLFPRPTAPHNIAFDAIINRTVLAMVQNTVVDFDAYADLFTDFYAPDASPAFLLRPPPGWPSSATWSESKKLPQALRDIHRELYHESDVATTVWASPAGTPPRYTQVTYGDIIAALHESGMSAGDDIPLLGAHGITPAESQALAGTRDADAAERLASVLESLSGLLPGFGGNLGITQVADAPRTPALERALTELLKKATVQNGSGSNRWHWRARDIHTVHRLHDRRAACRVRMAQTLGAPAPMLFSGVLLERRPDPVRVTIYVDVSGSMNRLLPHLRRALQSLRREVQPTLFWFSDAVVPASDHDLDRGHLPTTGGTEIGAVITHAMQHLPQGSAALVLTDGYVEPVPAARSTALKLAGISLHLGVVGDGPLHARDRWVTSSVRLPSP